MRLGVRRGTRRRRRDAVEAGGFGGGVSGGMALGEAGGKTEARGGGTDGAFALHRFARHEAGLRLVVDDAAARLREEMDAWTPATRNAEQIAGQRACPSGELDAVRGKRRDRHLAQRVAAGV